ncbi:MAG: hypothetical protein A3E85_01000 [Gammaproteobacteria bacterium RIFCSPHIGHO2_12_FULL_45_12]|nr:MAG: hypothetical protein A3E85_01000 [Gammaproteobacteria bacterium RIFCSPHIGHO2_12_FULL_45_12]
MKIPRQIKALEIHLVGERGELAGRRVRISPSAAAEHLCESKQNQHERLLHPMPSEARHSERSEESPKKHEILRRKKRSSG